MSKPSDGIAQNRGQSLFTIKANWATNDPRFPDHLPDDELVKHMTLRSGLMKYAMMADWCEECLGRLSNR